MPYLPEADGKNVRTLAEWGAFFKRDGKPNDIDVYEGRYGVEDMRQAVVEARLQGIDSFCLTVDRQAANYLPGVFGVGQYALLPRPELLPTVLLDWMRRLVQS